MAPRKPAKITTDEVMRLRRGALVVTFNYEEWVCVRRMWRSAGQPLGAIVPLFDSERGALGADGIELVRKMLTAAQTSALHRELQQSDDELFLLVKASWKLPYRKITDSSDTIWVGTKKLGSYDDPAAPPVPKIGDIPAFRAAFEKLSSLVAPTEGDLELEVIGLRFLAQRVRAGIA